MIFVSNFVETVRSTVIENQQVLTEWKAPVIAPEAVQEYDIYRSVDKVNYYLIASVPVMMHEYVDQQVDVQHQEYYYKVKVINVCNIETLQGNISSSVLLKAYQNETGNSIKWTRYIDWDTGVEKYVIEKQNALGNWEEVIAVPSSVTEWEENQ